jgi:ATP-GRASP peptide maturase of grasp-with-spasm system
MILIISNNKDRSTNEVIKWLIKKNKIFIRVHEDEIFDIKVYDKRICIKSDKNSFFIDEIKSLWYRRGGLRFKRNFFSNEPVNMHMNEVQHWLEDFVIKSLEQKRNISKQSTSHVNKLLVLERAKKCGLDIPNFFLSETTENVKINKTIVKSITGNTMLESKDGKFDAIMYTSIVKKEESSPFYVSFFQDYIEKDFEVRSFYLNGKIYSTAIFSQNDSQTKIDFRKYNNLKPNRNIHYNLPKEIEKKVHILMKSLDLNCGSIDFIKAGQLFYFLEVNPVGQFTGLSEICNFKIEKIIAEYL